MIPVNPQIHGNVMCPLFGLNFIFEPLFVHAELIESTLKQTIMYRCFNDFYGSRNMKNIACI